MRMSLAIEWKVWWRVSRFYDATKGCVIDLEGCCGTCFAGADGAWIVYEAFNVERDLPFVAMKLLARANVQYFPVCPFPPIYILLLTSSNNPFNFSMSPFCCGQLMPKPSFSFGLGIM